MDCISQYNLFILVLSRDNHCADHVHNHHWGERLHAPCFLHQSSGHLPVGQFCVCLPLSTGIRSSELPDYGARAEGEETPGQGEVFLSLMQLYPPGKGMANVWKCSEVCNYSMLLSAAWGECSACKKTPAVRYSGLQRFATDNTCLSSLLFLQSEGAQSLHI